MFANLADVFGLGGQPWYGYWDANVAMTEQPFTVSVVEPVPGGAADRAGLRNGDRIDLRLQSLEGRTRISTQPVGAQPTLLIVTRGARTFAARVAGSTLWDGQTAWKTLNATLGSIGGFWFLACAFLIATRPQVSRDARMLTLILILPSFFGLGPGAFVVPDARLNQGLSLIACICGATASVLLIVLTSRFGRRSLWRGVLEWSAYGANALSLAGCFAMVIGILTLWFDPLPYLLGGLGRIIFVVTNVAVAACAIAAVATTPIAERPRVGWLLVPLPLASAVATAFGSLYGLIPDWYLALAVTAVSQTFTLLGALAVTYALLKRRVLDLGFVVSRTIVVAIVSLIVLAAFVILESLLNTVLAGLSHPTGVVANVALALVLGVSLSYIHKRVDRFVETIFFRKRHDDERALIDFSKEAAYVTDSAALLDQAIGRIRTHTDARNATIFVEDRGSYAVARWYGDGSPGAIGENDGAILALKTWHKPLDPHHCDTAVPGALALPMLATGRLFGVVVLGERAGGEAYAPDEVAALAQFAHGVGTALDSLASRDAGSMEAWRETVSDALVSLNDAVRALPDAIAARLRDGLPSG
ncbi:MAG TPA: GAF domain-containing protein [Candidatus Baltobacteraceae bacterium]|jgi:hypothetical protein